jgi:hypothetical protein
MRVFRSQRPRLIAMFLSLLLTAALLTACGGGSNSPDTSGSSSNQSGNLAVSLTDAEGDFSSYTVDVLSLTLTKADGAQVNVLPRSTRLDFAQYTDMTEFLTAATVPSGVYVAASMILDYSNADIWVQNAAGDLVQVNTIEDENGSPLSQTEVTVQLDDRSRLVIAPGIPAHLQLDFDLAATNTVTFDDQGTPRLTVDPYLIADVNRVDSKIHRLRGLLDEVDSTAGTFQVILRPFYAALSGSQRYFGSMTVSTDSATLYEINGQPYQGQDGLGAMQSLDPLTAIVVVGQLTFNPLRFEADEVYAGTSVPWGNQDIVSGTVAARQGNQLTVKGATLMRSGGSVVFHDLVTVTMGAGTRVMRQFSLDDVGTDAVSVGQFITVFGTLTNTDPANLTLDATAGLIRMKLTPLSGTVTSMSPSDPTAQLKLDLQSLALHPTGIYDFSGTGVDAAHDADPADYDVGTGTLDLSGLSTGDPVRLRGFVQPFGAAPQDFNAQTIIRVADVPAFMRVEWNPASANAFESISADGLTLNLDGVGGTPALFRAWVFTDLGSLGQPVVVAPRDDGNGLFILNVDGVIQIYLTFDDFIQELQSDLAAGHRIQKIRARGSFDDAAATLTANLVDAGLI